MVITLFGETAIEPGMEEREASVADGVVASAPFTRRFEDPGPSGRGRGAVSP